MNRKLAAITAGTAALLCQLGFACDQGTCLEKLQGAWILSYHMNNFPPRPALEFKDNRVTITHAQEDPVTVDYKISSAGNDIFTISWEYTYPYVRANGDTVDLEQWVEIIYHEENGRPVLSEKTFEHDGRGDIICTEYLRKESFQEGFLSELAMKMNSKDPGPRR